MAVELNAQQCRQLAAELGIREKQAQQALKLWQEGATLPFIARYRKEATGNLDEVQLRKLFDAAEALDTLEKRRLFILEQAKNLGKLTPELERPSGKLPTFPPWKICTCLITPQTKQGRCRKGKRLGTFGPNDL